MYGTIKEEVYVCQPLGFEDPDYPDKVYKVRGKIDQTLFIKKQKGDILLVQVYVDDIIFGSTNKDLCKAFEKLMKDKFQMSSMVKRIFRYLKGKPYLGLSFPKDSPFNLVAYSDSDYAGVSLDRKSTTRRCQFLGCRLISWQCKKQTVVATLSTKVEYVAAASCYAQVLWIQNQLLDYRKKVIIIEATIREALRLDDAESIDCLPNEEIFTELSRMGVGKGFPGVDTPLFEGMIVAQQVDDVADEGATGVDVDTVHAAADEPSIPSPTPTTQPPPPSQELPSTSQDKIAQTLEITKLKQRVKKLEIRNKLKVSKLRRLKKHGTAQKVDTSEDTVMDDVSKQGEIIANIDVDEDVILKDVAAIAKEVDVEKDTEIEENDDEIEPAKLKEVVEVVTTAKLMTEVVTAASATITVATTTITAAPRAARRRKGVGMSYDDIRPIFEKNFNSNVDFLEKTKEQIEEEDGKALKRASESQVEKATKKQKLDEEGMSYDDIRPIFEKNFNSNVDFLEKTKEQIEEEDGKALKRASESQVEKATKKQKLDEEVK
uniref:Uncharacterized protein n=1 Tax=Tanacetum cinerariifolium TaxID=118510 RepID=A0A699I8L1_TANCI|nr:hypothetical protein [Tanacetum cinerariifolium]